MSEADLLTRVRALTINDAEEVARVNVLSYLEADRRSPRPEQNTYDLKVHLPINVSKWRRELGLAEDSDDKKFIGVFNGEALEGYIYYGPHNKDKNAGEIYALYVDPQSWGHGTGAKLLKDAAEAMKAEGYKKVMVKALGNDPIPNKFYRKMGFDLTPLFKKISGASRVEFEMDLDSLDI